ncbi:class I SAM-dependent methyltransferase [Nocardia jinanensis]|uniref:Class I SAM-dependent methyltransferase n=1 Tax=Nocardia jinanensis TaxID=382504 RepID=A0A917VRC6_9NOCA|nr:class I SAM-dependent methyltransferase [Nocardia jinanensis]GGL11029.1 hypothetical protein GCM10011588_26940 [Nocardia jinanensis]
MLSESVFLLRRAAARIGRVIHGVATYHVDGLDRLSGRRSGLLRYTFHVESLDSEAALQMKRNNRTIAGYDENVEAYLKQTTSSINMGDGGHGTWLGVYVDALQIISRQTGRVPRVLDLASGPRPRDGRVYRDLGFDVTLSDGSSQCVERLREAGFNAEKINMITDDFGGPWDGISINGGVPHLSPEDLEKVIRKAAGSLSDGGILAYNYKIVLDESDSGHRVVYNKGADKDYYLRYQDMLDPWELRYGLFPVPSPTFFDSGGTHLWSSKVLIKDSTLIEQGRI